MRPVPPSAREQVEEPSFIVVRGSGPLGAAQTAAAREGVRVVVEEKILVNTSGAARLLSMGVGDFRELVRQGAIALASPSDEARKWRFYVPDLYEFARSRRRLYGGGALPARRD